MDAVLNMANVFQTIYAYLPFSVRALINVSIISFLLVVAFTNLNRIRS